MGPVKRFRKPDPAGRRALPLRGAAAGGAATSLARRRHFVPHPAGRRALLAVLLMVLAFVSGCAVHKPDLTRLYAHVTGEPKAEPLIVIPGVMGSRLTNAQTGREIWPGSLLNLATGNRFEELALPLEMDTHRQPAQPLAPATLFLDMAGQDFYNSLVGTLEGPGGYHCVPKDRVNADTDCVLFSWDWRKDLVKAAADLDALVDRLAALRNDPGLRVNILGHSAGGLVTRYFLRYGGSDVLTDRQSEITNAGARKVHKAILIGTPNFGSISALQQALRGMDAGLARIPPEIIATMPGLYQLLPHPERTWMIDINGRRIERDVYDPATWRTWQWSIFDPDARQRVMRRFRDPGAGERYLARLEASFEGNLERARRFQLALSNPQHQPPNKYVVFGGDCFMTPARCLLEHVDGEAKVRLFPDEIRDPVPDVNYDALMLEPGDGTVTKASLMGRDNLDSTERGGGLFPIDYPVFLCEKHFRLAGNMTFRDNLLNILLY